MAIDKKALKKRYAANRFKRVHSKKSSFEVYSSATSNGSGNSANEDTAHSSLDTVKSSVSAASHISQSRLFTESRQVSSSPFSENANFVSSDSGISHIPVMLDSDNVSQKSNITSDVRSYGDKTTKNIKNLKKIRNMRMYNRNRQQIYRNKLRNKKLVKKSVKSQNIKHKFIKSLMGKKAIAVIIAGIIGSSAIIAPLVLLMSFCFSSSANFMDGVMGDVYATYPADENDITRVNLHWQTLTQALKEKHRKLPDEITDKYDEKKAETADIMDDNNKLLSFISAYYGPWKFEDVEDFITKIFTEMYAIEYGFTSETKKKTHNVEYADGTVPDPLPDNYKMIGRYPKDGKDIYVVAVTEDVTIVTLHYNIVEKKNFDEIVNEYLNDAKKELYKNYYERKGGAIKAFSSPFAFDWTNLITSPFGYRDWGGGNVEFHKGLDFGVPNGTEILAVADGTVEVGTGCTHNYPKDGSCGCNGGFGNYVEIHCENGTLILYGHMSQVAVQNGQQVKNGQVIGYSGCTGWSTGFHCHLQMVKDGEYIDPLVFIRPYSGTPQQEDNKNNG